MNTADRIDTGERPYERPYERKYQPIGDEAMGRLAKDVLPNSSFWSATNPFRGLSTPIKGVNTSEATLQAGKDRWAAQAGTFPTRDGNTIESDERARAYYQQQIQGCIDEVDEPTLRDRFAMHVIATCIELCATTDSAADEAYLIADAMIKARAK